MHGKGHAVQARNRLPSFRVLISTLMLSDSSDAASGEKR
jgi:hypothetical protein